MVEIETRVWRRVIRRRRYHPSCGCGVLPGIVTAPSPARLIRRGKLGISVWVRVILDKYLYSRPSHRLLQELASQGVRLSPGTIAGGLRQLLPLLEPVREAIRSRQLSEDRWQADETGWRVFVEVEGKVGHGWHLWVFRSPSTVLFTLSPSRSAQVTEAHFGEEAAGILLSDRYVVYKKLARQREGLELAFCWAHVRRDFFCLANNARFLILPWVESKNLASKLLALASRQLPQDWQDRYAYRPVLLETFVDTGRFTGACYKAANWIHVGQTQGRGKLDRDHKADLPTKSIWLYPLSKHFRRSLRST